MILSCGEALIDMLRGQAWTLPADLEFGLDSAWSDSSVTEASGTVSSCSP